MRRLTKRTAARAAGACLAISSILSAPAHASEIWVAPTYQEDFGGLGVGSNVVWPVTPAGAVRLAWAVPGDLLTFQSAKLVLIPQAAGASTLTVFICPAKQNELVTAACAGPFNHPFTGVANQLTELDVSSTVAPLVGAPGANYLSLLAFTAPTTSTDRIVGLRFAYDPVPPGGVATLGANTFSGTQTAPGFVGNGSGLANVNAALLNGIDSTGFAAVHGHDVSHVTNAARLAGGNTFSGTQTVNGGNLDLDDSTAATGVLMKNGARFLHNFGNGNTFLGRDAGNFSMTGHANTAIGHGAFRSNTAGQANTATGIDALALNTTGSGNTASGDRAMVSNTTGEANSSVGGNALADNIDGSRNAALGHSALRHNTVGFSNTANGTSALHFTLGNRNTASGDDALRNNSTGSRNVGFGWNAGLNATTGSNNIYLGSNVLGVADESNAIYLGIQGTHTKTVIGGIRGTSVTGGEAVLVDADGRLGSGPVGPAANTIGTGQVIDDSLTAADLAPNSVGSSEVAFNYAGSASKGGAAADLACVGCVAATEVSFSFATPGVNTFTGTQAINAGNLNLQDSTATTGNLTKNGVRFLHNFSSSTFLGFLAGNFTMSGAGNTGTGFATLADNTTGSGNTATGSSALTDNTTGHSNTALGSVALARNTVGDSNTAVGLLSPNANTSGSRNTAGGFAALINNGIGSDNVALGYNAGANLTAGSNNIYLGAHVEGVAGEIGTMYLGKVGAQIRTFIAGVRGIPTGVPNAVPVVIDSLGQLGTINSSRRVKEDIADMGGASRRLLHLRPVTFRYTQAYTDGSKPIQVRPHRGRSRRGVSGAGGPQRGRTGRDRAVSDAQRAAAERAAAAGAPHRRARATARRAYFFGVFFGIAHIWTTSDRRFTAFTETVFAFASTWPVIWRYHPTSSLTDG